MADTITTNGMKKRMKRFLSCQSLEDFSLLLGKTALNLLALAESPAYDAFQIVGVLRAAERH